MMRTEQLGLLGLLSCGLIELRYFESLRQLRLLYFTWNLLLYLVYLESPGLTSLKRKFHQVYYAYYRHSSFTVATFSIKVIDKTLELLGLDLEVSPRP